MCGKFNLREQLTSFHLEVALKNVKFIQRQEQTNDDWL